MKTKEFSKKLHDQYDKFGRDIVKKYFQDASVIVATDNPDPYGVDLILTLKTGGSRTGYAEVEVRNSWRGITFPYRDLNIPARKAKLLRRGLDGLPVLFFSINREGTALFYCNGQKVLKNAPVKLDNKYVKGEHFYKVDLSDLIYRVLK